MIDSKRGSSYRREVEILYQDKYLIAVNKPAGLVVQGAKRQEESLLIALKSYLKERENKAGEVFLAVVHRLDKPVSGVCLLARRSKCAAKLFKIIQEGLWEKVYVAKVEGILKEKFGLWEDYLCYEVDAKRVQRFNRQVSAAKRALTFFQVLETEGKTTLLLLSPLTGRKHQLRAVLSGRGYPIIGDIRYGSKVKILGGKAILLHALYLALPHPYEEKRLELWADFPSYFRAKTLDKNLIIEFLYRIRLLKERGNYVPSQNLGD